VGLLQIYAFCGHFVDRFSFCTMYLLNLYFFLLMWVYGFGLVYGVSVNGCPPEPDLLCCVLCSRYIFRFFYPYIWI
jgi:hypothetical protein